MLSTISDLEVQFTYNLDEVVLYIYDYFVLSVVKEGVMIDKNLCLRAMNIFTDHFGEDKPFAYITLRENSYSVDPTVYFTLRNQKNLKAFAVISKKEIDFFNFKIEKFFFKQPNMKIFYDKKSAFMWVNNILGVNNS
ncbi:STAS/SEC14 domain-containing protein [Neptunitalea lumnitzerae]|uniref:STAS/SEC14 domain-containing protein n=1 Tax=Neptunitalea lumnitzerae TaxID=2965509 RepID=A0ABQ5ML17_9FLAO|nr:STAS/SEC14 domain-containing protein [Neptunitalea sp. Y10]GLB50108.1 hypothetical protein Y10_24760 [Neptunitalea sp. Y10]